MWYVEWVDSATECGTAWHDRKEQVDACEETTLKDLSCRTCGFCLYNTEDFIVITQSYHESEVGVCITIPTKAITKITVLAPSYNP